MIFYRIEPISKYELSIIPIHNLLEVGDGEFFTLDQLQEQYPDLDTGGRRNPHIYLYDVVRSDLEALVKQIPKGKTRIRLPSGLEGGSMFYVCQKYVPDGYKITQYGYDDIGACWYLAKIQKPRPKVKAEKPKPTIHDFRAFVKMCETSLNHKFKGNTKITITSASEDKVSVINLFKTFLTFTEVIAAGKAYAESHGDASYSEMIFQQHKRMKVIWDNPAYSNKKVKQQDEVNNQESPTADPAISTEPGNQS